MADGDYILYLDSDQYLHRDTIKECMLWMESLGYEMFSIPEINWPLNLLNQSINYEKEFTSYGRDKMLPRFFNRKVFEAIGGFNEDRTFDEDIELFIRAKKAGFENAKTYLPMLHDEATSIWNIIKKYYYYGSISTLNKRGKYDKEISKYYGFDAQFLKNLGIFFLKNPFIFCLGAAIKIIKYLSFFAGMVFNKTERFKYY